MMTWFITGASRGIGRELAEQLLKRGDRVAATMRNVSALDGLAEQYGERLWRAQLDVTETADVFRVVEQAFTDLGRIDAVVSNAGYGIMGAAEEYADAQVDELISTNLTASIHLTRAVTPHLRRQGGGHISQVSSMGAHIGFAGFSLYHASKWGIEGFFEAFTKEVTPFGITTTLIEPGMIRTSFYEASRYTPVADAYADHPEIIREVDPAQLIGSQGKVVEQIIVNASAAQPEARLLLGSDAWEMVTSALRTRLMAAEAQRDQAAVTDIDHEPTQN